MADATRRQRICEIEARYSDHLTASQGEIIIHESDEEDRVLFLLSGRIRATTFSMKGREVRHSELDAGVFVGELAALTGAPRSVSITAVEPCKFAVLTKVEFFELLRSEPEIGIWLLQDLANRLQERTEDLSSLVAQTTPQRIRAELLRLARRSSAPNDELTISPVPNLTEFARRLNTDRENVSREISALKRIGVISKDKSHIRILNREFLENSAIV